MKRYHLAHLAAPGHKVMFLGELQALQLLFPKFAGGIARALLSFLFRLLAVRLFS